MHRSCTALRFCAVTTTTCSTTRQAQLCAQQQLSKCGPHVGCALRIVPILLFKHGCKAAGRQRRRARLIVEVDDARLQELHVPEVDEALPAVWREKARKASRVSQLRERAPTLRAAGLRRPGFQPASCF